jgi:uncharacterized protein
MAGPVDGRSPHGPSRGADRHGEELRRLELRRLDVPSGGARGIAAPVPIDPIQIGGQAYLADPAAPELQLDVVRVAGGWHFRLRGGLTVVGPCWRCLEPARLEVLFDATEISMGGADDPELSSLYFTDDGLELSDWARDVVVEVMPAVVLCAEDCAGLCPSCGANLNDGPCDCPTAVPDSRWAALAELAERLAGGEPGVTGGGV